MRFIARKADWGMLLALILIESAGLACRSVRVVPPVISSPPAAVVPVRQSVTKVQGHVYSPRDTTTVVPGIELVFTSSGPDSTLQRWRDVTKADGFYQVTVPAGATYQLAVNKDGLNIETQEYAVPVEQTDTGSVVKNIYLMGPGDTCCIDRIWLKNAYFDTNRATLRAKSMFGMNTAFQLLKDNAELGISIEGHAEPQETPVGQTEPEKYLQRLGQRRAEAAYAYLVKTGISKSRLNLVSYGAKRPAAPNDTPENRQLNRRVEFKMFELNILPAKSENGGISTSQKKPAHTTKKPVPVKLKPRSTK